MKEIEKLDVIHMKPFPDGSIYDVITVAHKLNEVIDRVNRLANPPAQSNNSRPDLL